MADTVSAILALTLFLPLPALAAGAVASTDKAEICAGDGHPGSFYSRTHRLVHRPGRAGYEHDHIVPICLGGADTEANLQWQPIAEAREKDRVEAAACRAVCRGAVSLSVAQGWFLGDWHAAEAVVFK